MVFLLVKEIYFVDKLQFELAHKRCCSHQGFVRTKTAEGTKPHSLTDFSMSRSLNFFLGNVVHKANGSEPSVLFSLTYDTTVDIVSVG